MVYSRITGYYRPVQNWNDGKTQEYKDRLAYAPKKFEGVSPKGGVKAEAAAEACACESEEADRNILFSTPTCPNCKAAAMFLDKAGIAYEKLSANDNPELVKEFGITQAPTLIHISGGKVEKIANLSNIRAFTER